MAVFLVFSLSAGEIFLSQTTWKMWRARFRSTPLIIFGETIVLIAGGIDICRRREHGDGVGAGDRPAGLGRDWRRRWRRSVFGMAVGAVNGFLVTTGQHRAVRRHAGHDERRARRHADVHAPAADSPGPIEASRVGRRRYRPRARSDRDCADPGAGSFAFSGVRASRTKSLCRSAATRKRPISPASRSSGHCLLLFVSSGTSVRARRRVAGLTAEFGDRASRQ